MPPCILSASLLLPIPLHVSMVRMRLSVCITYTLDCICESIKKRRIQSGRKRNKYRDEKNWENEKKDLDLRCIENNCYYCYDFLFTHFFFSSWYVLLFCVASISMRMKWWVWKIEIETETEREHSLRCSSKIGSSCPLHARRTNEVFCCVCCCWCCWYIFSGVIILIDWPLSLKLPISYESISTEYCSSSHFYGYSSDY